MHRRKTARKKLYSSRAESGKARERRAHDAPSGMRKCHPPRMDESAAKAEYRPHLSDGAGTRPKEPKELCTVILLEG